MTTSYCKFYIQSILMYLKGRMEYRHFFLTGIGSVLLMQFARFGLIWILIDRFQGIAGWTLEQMGFLFGLWLIAHGLGIIFFRQFWNFDWFVHRGELDKFLLRPQPVLFQLCANRIEPIGLGDFIPGVLIFTACACRLHFSIGLPQLFLLIAVIIGALLIEVGIALMISTLSFWLIRTRAFNLSATEINEQITRYPISIYAKPFIFIISFVFPLAFMNYFPSTLFLQKPDALFPLWLGYLTPVVGALIISLAISFWQLGLKHYQGAGS